MPVLVWKSNKISTIQKDYIWKPSTCGCETNRYLKSVADDLVITHYEIINVSDTATINVHDKEATCNMDNYYVFSLFFLSLTILLLIATIFYYCIKYRSKQKYILPC